jgi:hypothetical protein
MKIIDRRDIPVLSFETAGLENPAYRGMGYPVNGYLGSMVKGPKEKIAACAAIFSLACKHTIF